MGSKEYYSTGEAARLLNISRSTISRKFDLGGLSGKRHPITGERLVSRESIETLMRLYHVHPETLMSEKRRILLVTLDNLLVSSVTHTFQDNPNVDIARLPLECSILNECLEKPPDLLVIDGTFTYLPWSNIIRSLREIEELKDLRILCFSQPEEIHQFLAWGADEVWPKEEMQGEDGMKRFHSLVNIRQQKFEAEEPFKHHRIWTRVKVHLPVRIWLYRSRTPSLRDAGEATLENISCGGAFLSGIHLTSGLIPCEPFGCFLRIDHPPFKKWWAHAKVVRLLSNEESVAAGVQFDRIPKTSLRMIQALY